MADVPSRREVLRAAAVGVAGAMIGCRTGNGTGPVISVDEPLSPAEEALGKEEVSAPSAAGDARGTLRVLLVEADGSPLDTVRMKQLDVRDLWSDPVPVGIALEKGAAKVELPREPVQLMTRLKVPGFGEINCWADNGGRGYARSGEVDFVVEAAVTRRRRVGEALRVWERAGVPITPEIRRNVAAANAPMPKGGARESVVAWAYSSLAESLHAGEKLALERAKYRIAKLLAPRKDFYFAGAMWRPGEAPQRDELFKRVFNFATVSWYSWKAPEPPAERIDYGRMDRSIDWCLANGITPKGFGYTYMARGATPEWVRPSEEQVKNAKGPVFNKDWPYERILALYKETQEKTAARYRDKLKYIEVINEAHDKANLWRLSHEQILEMTVESLRACRRGSPTIKRQINHCCLWAEYAKQRNWDGSRRWSPHRFMREVLRAGGEFEVVGLQLYYPRMDLFEIDRQLDRFASLNRPCHITEIAVNSVDGLDPASMRPKDLVPGWHGPWNETMQADWAEAIYTLCYSKPHFETVGWWDMADTPGHFWPNGALLKADFTPKEAYHRIEALQKRWGWGKGEVKS